MAGRKGIVSNLFRKLRSWGCALHPPKGSSLGRAAVVSRRGPVAVAVFATEIPITVTVPVVIMFNPAAISLPVPPKNRSPS